MSLYTCLLKGKATPVGVGEKDPGKGGTCVNVYKSSISLSTPTDISPSLLHSLLQLRRAGSGRAFLTDRGHRAHLRNIRRCVPAGVPSRAVPGTGRASQGPWAERSLVRKRAYSRLPRAVVFLCGGWPGKEGSKAVRYLMKAL